MSTKNLVPRASGEGQIGTSSKKWDKANFVSGSFDELNIGTVSLDEKIDDRVNDLLTAGSNITLTYDDNANTLTIAASGGGGGDIEGVTAGVGLSGGGDSGTVSLALDLNELTAAAVDVSTDSIAIIDFNDSNASRKETIADVVTAIAGNGLSSSSGVLAVGVDDASIEINTDSLRIKASGVTNTMLANSSVSYGGVSLSLGGTDATPAFDLSDATNYPASSLSGNISDSQLNAISTANKVSITAVDIDGGTDIGADLVDADLIIVDDGAAGTNRKSALSRIKKYIYSSMSGDATSSDAGVLTLAADSVEGSMLNANTISGQTAITAHGDLQTTDEFLIYDDSATDLKKIDLSVLKDYMQNSLSFGGTFDIDGYTALGGTGLHQTEDHFVFSDNGTEKKINFSNLQDAIFADVSGDATIAAGGALTIAAGSVENSMLAGSIANAKLANSSTTIGTTAISLGGSSTVLAGLTQLDIDNIRIDGNTISSTNSNGDMILSPDGTGKVVIDGDGTPSNGGVSIENGLIDLKNSGSAVSKIKFYCESSNAHAQTLQGAPHSESATNTLVLPSAGGNLISDTATQTLTNKTLTSPTITGLATPTNDGDAASKSYVDSVAAGLDIYDSVKAATTASFTMASTASTGTLVLADGEGGFNSTADTFTVDGVSLSQNDRVLIKDGVNSNSEGVSNKWNGIYTVGDLSGSTLTLTRSTDMDASSEFNSGAFFFVEQGTVNADTGFVLTNDSTVTVGTTLIVFTQFSGAGQITAGNGLAKSGNELSVNVDGSTIEINSDTLRIKDFGVTNSKLTGNISDSKLSTISTANKINISAIDLDGATEIGGALADSDLIIIDDNAAGNNKTSKVSRISDYTFAKISGDATVASTGALTLSADAVEGSMLNDNVISGQTEMTGDVADTDELLISDAGTIKRADFSVVRDAVFNDISGDATIAAGGSLSLSSTSITGQTAETTIADDDLILISDTSASGALRKMTKANFVSGLSEGSTAADNITVGDSAVNISTTLGNITIDAQANDSDIIFKGTDNSLDITMLTLDGSDAGTAIFNHDVKMQNDGAILSLGADNDVSLTHVADTGLLLNSSRKLQFGDSGTFIHQSADGVLTIEADTKVDINGSVTMDGALTGLTSINVTGTITGDTSLTLDTTTITTAEIGVLDSVTPGTAAASKALVLDANKDIGTIRNLTIDGTFSDGNYTFDTSGNVSGLGTVGCGAITSTGTSTFAGGVTPASADGAALGSASAEWSDLYLALGGQILFGNNQKVTVTHEENKGLILKNGNVGDDNPFVLTLQTGETDIAVSDVIGKIDFQAPDEGTGTDAILVCAGIEAVSEGDFSASNNATKLSFKTASSETAAEKMSLSSGGNLTISGDIILDDGGSLKEAGGTAAITFDGSGHVTKIGQDSPSNGEFLQWDGSKAVWAASSGGASALNDLSDASVSSASSGQILIHDGIDSFANVTVSGDISISSSGITELQPGAITDLTNLGATPAGTDELLISDAGTLKAITVTNLMAAASGGGFTYDGSEGSASFSAAVEKHYSVDTSGASGNITATLPTSASGNSGKEIRFKLMDATHNLIIAVQSGQKIEGTTDGTYTMDVALSAITCVSNGSNGWEII